MAWGHQEEAGTKETSGGRGALQPFLFYPAVSIPAWEGTPKGQMGDRGSEEEVKRSRANHVQALLSGLFLYKLT